MYQRIWTKILHDLILCRISCLNCWIKGTLSRLSTCNQHKVFVCGQNVPFWVGPGPKMPSENAGGATRFCSLPSYSLNRLWNEEVPQFTIGNKSSRPTRKGRAHCMAEKTSGAYWRRAGYPCSCLYKSNFVDRSAGEARRAPPRQNNNKNTNESTNAQIKVYPPF